MSYKKLPLALAGLLQSLAIAVYISLIASFIFNMERLHWEPAGVLGGVLMLSLLVFSAAICGVIIFGYPVILVLDKKVKEALKVLGYTFIYSLIIIAILLITIFF